MAIIKFGNHWIKSESPEEKLKRLVEEHNNSVGIEATRTNINNIRMLKKELSIYME